MAPILEAILACFLQKVVNTSSKLASKEIGSEDVRPRKTPASWWPGGVYPFRVEIIAAEEPTPYAHSTSIGNRCSECGFVRATKLHNVGSSDGSEQGKCRLGGKRCLKRSLENLFLLVGQCSHSNGSLYRYTGIPLADSMLPVALHGNPFDVVFISRGVLTQQGSSGRSL